MGNLWKSAICLLFSLMILSACTDNFEKDGSAENIAPDVVQAEITTTSQTPLIPEAQKNVLLNAPQIEFGYANMDGDKIIVLYDHEVENNRLLTYFEYAVGGNGNSFEIEYSAYQQRNQSKDNGRQSVINFDNESGCIYNVVNTKAIPNDTYMLLTKKEYEKITIYQENENAGIVAASDELLSKCAKLADRKAKNGWKLSEYQNNIVISMIEFENIGDDLLAWLVIEDGESFCYYEFPAILNGYSGWRLEDYGSLEENFIFPLCTIQNGHGIVVYLGWCSEETEIIHAIEFSTSQTVNERIVSSRYIYPI